MNSVKATWPPVYVGAVVTLNAQSVYFTLPLETYWVALAAGLALEKSGALKAVTVPVWATPPMTPDHVAELAAKSARS